MNIQQLQRPGIPNEDSVIRGRHLDDHAAATHVCNQGPGSRYDEFLQLIQEHRAMAEVEEPDGGVRWEEDDQGHVARAGEVATRR